MKKKSKKILIIVIFCLLIVMGIRMMPGKAGSSDGNQGKKVKVYLKESENLSEQESEHNYDILQERIKVFCKGFSHHLEKEDNLITFTFPEKCLAYFDTLDVLENFLAEPVNYEVIRGEECRLLAPEDILSMEKGKGIVEGIEDSSKTTCYFRYKFTEDFLNDVKRIQKGEIDSIYLMDEYVYSDYDTNNAIYYRQLFRGEDGAYYEIYDEDDLEDGNEEIFLYDMTHERLSAPYNFYEEKEVSWETNGDFGEYQKKKEDMKEDSYYLQYSCDEMWTNDVRLKEENILKARLDSLEILYSIGEATEGGFAVLLESMPLSKAMMEALAGQSRIYLRCDNYVIHYNLSDENGGIQMEWIEEEECFQVMVKGEEMEKILGWMKASNKPLYLAVENDYHFLGIMESTDEMKADSFVFKILPGNEKECSLMKEIIMNPGLEKIYSLDYCKKGNQVNEDSLFAKDQKKDTLLEQIHQEIEKICPSSDIKLDQSRIYLNLEKGEKFPEETLEIMKQIMDCLKETEIPVLYLYPTALKEEERGWFSIDYRDESGKIKIYAVIYHGDMEKYKEIFEEKMKQDSYWKQYSIEFLGTEDLSW